MPKVKIASVHEGMVVAADVKNMDSMLLIPAGCALTEKHIDICNAWGITEGQVEAGGGPEDGGDVLQQVPPEVLEKARTGLTDIFWETIAKDTLQADTFDLVLRRKVRHLVEEQPYPHDDEY
jgi:hypothetical protein